MTETTAAPMPFTVAMQTLQDAAAALMLVRGNGDPADMFRTVLDAANVCTARMLEDIVADRCPMSLEDAEDYLSICAIATREHLNIAEDRDALVLKLATAGMVTVAALLHRSTEHQP